MMTLTHVYPCRKNSRTCTVEYVDSARNIQGSGLVHRKTWPVTYWPPTVGDVVTEVICPDIRLEARPR